MKYTSANKPLVCMQTHSTCYKNTSKMTIKGVLWHSTGAANPNLKRYIQPWDNSTIKEHNDNTYTNADWIKILGKNSNGNDWNHKSRSAGLNCWIGKLADGSVTTVQTMPWNFKPGGCASGKNGSCNNGWIQFEICEDSLTNKDYFDKVYKEACEITAYLCKEFNINPIGTVMHGGKKVPTILCHQDAYKLGLGSGHADVYHWFKKYGKTMDSVRNDVSALLKGADFNDSGTSRDQEQDQNKDQDDEISQPTTQPAAAIEPVLVRNLTVVNIGVDTAKIELLTSENFNDYSWTYTLSQLTGISKKLTPNTAYSLEFSAEDKFNAIIKSPLIVFNTIQDLPYPVSDITFELDTADLLTGTCRVSFTPPSSWGTSSDILAKGYRVSLFINGIEKGFSDDLLTTGSTTIKTLAVTDLLSKLKIESLQFTDTIQIGIQPWIKDIQNNYIFASEFPKCSKAIYLKHILKVINKVFIRITTGFKAVVFYNTK